MPSADFVIVWLIFLVGWTHVIATATTTDTVQKEYKRLIKLANHVTGDKDLRKFPTF